MRTFCRLAAVIGLFGLAAAAVQGAGVYTIQRIVRLGDKVGTPPITTSVGLWVGALNDRGQIAFISGSSGGGPALFQYDNGQFTPLVVAGQYGPLGKWSSLLELWSPVSMNQAGNVVFSVWDHQLGTPIGNFVWDAKAHQITAVAPKGTPIGGNLTLVESGGPSPVTNDQNEIALVADVKNSAGEAQTGVFFLGRDGRLQPVVLPDGSLPDATFCRGASHPSVNNNGAVTFLALREGDPYPSAYLWENGQLSPVAIVGASAPGGGGTIAAVWGAWVNNKNHNVLVEASVKTPTAAHSLFVFRDGSLTAAALAGKALPDGVNLKSVAGGVSAANDAGEHAFLVSRSDGTTAAYLIDAAGNLTLLAISSLTHEPGSISRVGEAGTFGVAINNKRQVALVIKLAGERSSALVLLTPK